MDNTNDLEDVPMQHEDEPLRYDDDNTTEDNNGASLPAVEEIHASVQPSSKHHRSNRFLLIVSSVTCVVALLVIGAVIALAKDDPAASNGIAKVLHTRPRASVDDIVKYISLAGITREDVLYDETTPQHEAVEWMSKKDGLKLPIPTASIDTKEGYDFAARYIMAVNYFSLGGAKWKNQFRFLSDSPTCLWTGVLYDGEAFTRAGTICDSKEKITGIYLDSNNLAGTIPSENGFLKTLKTFDLNFNDKIDGVIPNSICFLNQLERLAIGYNELAGEIPACIGSLTNLELLFLANTKMGGAIPEGLSDLTSMDTLFLDDNMFTGDVTKMFRKMSNLRYLYAEDNLLSGELDDGFLSGKTWLRHVDLSRNRITGKIPTNLLKNPLMQVVDLHSNKITGEIPDEALLSRELLFLALHDNSLTGTIPWSLKNFTQLYHLDLSKNEFEGDIPEYFGQMTNLQYLFLANNLFNEGPIPEAWQGLTKMQEMSLKSTKRNGKIPAYIRQWTDLELLDLDNNHLTGRIPDVFEKTSKLEFFLVNRNKQLSGSLPTSLTALTSLRAAFFDNTNITDSFAAMCKLPAFNNMAAENDINRHVLTANCGGDSAQVTNCPCCSLCCDAASTEPCNPNSLIANLDPEWENLYQRVDFRLGNETRFVDKTFLDNFRGDNN